MIPPLQLLLVVEDGLLFQITIQQEIILGHCLSLLQTLEPEPPTFFPDLDCSLPYEWIDSSLVTDKVPKTDDNAILINLWNQHTILISNITISSLNAL